MNKKGKEGGSTWFNPRQTEIPLFKINKKKKKGRQGQSAGTPRESSCGAGHFVAGIGGIGSVTPSGKDRESWAPLKFLFFVSVRAGVWGWGPALVAPLPSSGADHPEGFGKLEPEVGTPRLGRNWGLGRGRRRRELPLIARAWGGGHGDKSSRWGGRGGGSPFPTGGAEKALPSALTPPLMGTQGPEACAPLPLLFWEPGCNCAAM